MQRRIIGGVIPYKGARIWAEEFGDLFICKVDGKEVGCFFLDIFAVEKAGKQYVDDLEVQRDRTTCDDRQIPASKPDESNQPRPDVAEVAARRGRERTVSGNR